MRQNPLTPDILIETLKRSNLPTVLIEGKDDIIIYRKFQNKIGARYVSFQECGGRNTLLKIFDRKDELSNKKIMFIADKDMWVFSSVPEKYNEIFFTKGYSIENDLYEDGQSLIQGFFSDNEKDRFKKIIQEIIYWFAFEVNKIKSDEGYDAEFSEVTILSTKTFNKALNKFTEYFISKRGIENFQNETVIEINDNYIQKLRGKFIFQVLELLFQERINKEEVTYTKNQLFDLCYTIGIQDNNKETNMNRFVNELLEFKKKKIYN
ncbi:MAG: DUF4435 domain-containing protein [Bacteroidales bacterium]|nr:DUF4435 domain-containing protein [Bacteroidales bacterium]